MVSVSECRILLVDDDALVRFVLAAILADAGFAVTEAASGDDAAAWLEGHDRFDVLITDIQMPGRLDGMALCDVARARFPDMPVILVSGRSDLLARVECAGTADFCLRKPYMPEEIITVVRGITERSGAAGERARRERRRPPSSANGQGLGRSREP